tara:strand:+ start:4675 stop:5853 length:1179 start_codon:yes stop_codon:yes gene_type:complete
LIKGDPVTTTETAQVKAALDSKLGVIDVDFHPMPLPTDPQVADHIPQRWRDYIARYGLGQVGGGQVVYQREFTQRLDAVDRNGRVGIDPHFGVEQVLDKYDMSAVVLTCPQAYIITHGGHNMPIEMALALYSAYNDALAHTWMGADPRYHASISVARDLGGVVEEIERCKAGPNGDRFSQILMTPAGQDPLGKQRYWHIFEAAEALDIPLGFHVPGYGRFPTGAGHQNFYVEMHAAFGALPMGLIPSLIFEGVFDRFPKLRIAILEMGWDWVVSFGWQLDALYDAHRDEVSHLQRKPSEYLRDHFWFSTQPLEEPEHSDQLEHVFRIFEESGLGDKLMYSSDWPHWDSDSPYESVPANFPEARRRRMLGQNASNLYNIPLLKGHGLPDPAFS